MPITFISNIIKIEQLKNITNNDYKNISGKLNSDFELTNFNGIIKNEDYLPLDAHAILKGTNPNNIIDFTKYIKEKYFLNSPSKKSQFHFIYFIRLNYLFRKNKFLNRKTNIILFINYNISTKYILDSIQSYEKEKQ